MLILPNRTVSTPVALTEAMHNCHVTVQVWNKLVARADWVEEGRSVPDDLMADYLVVVWAILLDGKCCFSTYLFENPLDLGRIFEYISVLYFGIRPMEAFFPSIT